MEKVNLFWLRRDLRLDDNCGLFHALEAGLPLVPVFIFDTTILDDLPEKNDRRVNFIHDALQDLQFELAAFQSTLDVRYGNPLEVFRQLVQDYSIHSVFANHDYEPYARQRDAAVDRYLQSQGIAFKTYKDQVIFEKNEVVKDNGSPYAVYTPYARKWKSLLNHEATASYNTRKHMHGFYRQKQKPVPALHEIGFVENTFPSAAVVDRQQIIQYHRTRDLPGIDGTTMLGVHLRFGTISIRQLVAKAMEWNEVFLGELIWREFFMQMLWHAPRLVHECFRTEYENIQWRNNEEEFKRWCHGTTGYPLVDAGMRQLNSTGFMHNRVRMVTASFLVKHLLIDWRWGEAYFAARLNDYELASNNGNWQWVAGCGCDAAPYFRIFNPHEQTKRFDPELAYIRKWVPELDTFQYPGPIVEHSFARERCLAAYKKALSLAGRSSALQ